jgi:hypothetical protein
LVSQSGALFYDVRGFIALDQIYLPDGASFHRDDPIAANDLLLAFFIFGTHWKSSNVTPP